jgi:hypothetical protein
MSCHGAKRKMKTKKKATEDNSENVKPKRQLELG